MTPSPPAAGRLSLLVCALLATLAPALPGCGEEGSAAPENATAERSGVANTTEAERPGAGGRRSAGVGACPAQVTAFVKSLDGLRDQLAVGLSYDQYATAIGDLRSSYDRIPVDRLALDCLAATGTPAERALNRYIDGANAWGECLADASCTTATIEPVLQRKWRVASRFLSEAR